MNPIIPGHIFSMTLENDQAQVKNLSFSHYYRLWMNKSYLSIFSLSGVVNLPSSFISDKFSELELDEL